MLLASKVIKAGPKKATQLVGKSSGLTGISICHVTMPVVLYNPCTYPCKKTEKFFSEFFHCFRLFVCLPLLFYPVCEYGYKRGSLRLPQLWIIIIVREEAKNLTGLGSLKR